MFLRVKILKYQSRKVTTVHRPTDRNSFLYRNLCFNNKNITFLVIHHLTFKWKRSSETIVITGCRRGHRQEFFIYLICCELLMQTLKTFSLLISNQSNDFKLCCNSGGKIIRKSKAIFLQAKTNNAWAFLFINFFAV